MNRIDDCKVIAKRLNLRDTLAHIEMVKSSEVLSAAKFKQITKAQIRSKVLNGIFRSSDNGLIFLRVFAVIGYILSAYALFKLESGIFLALLLPAPLMLFATFCVALAIEELFNVDISKKEIAEWGFGFPYGALIAIEEAKNLGLETFEIYFPTIGKDPVIIGYKFGIMYEIFSWRDGNIYE